MSSFWIPKSLNTNQLRISSSGILPQCCQRDVKQNIYSCLISRLPKIIVKKNSEDPGDDDKELGEEHDQEDTENGNDVWVSNISPETSGVKLKMKAEALSTLWSWMQNLWWKVLTSKWFK